jgi:TfoX/Sxy family transcriptional regulator of competence genes
MPKLSSKKSDRSDAAFAHLAAAISKDPRVDAPEVAGAKGFGSKGLKVARKLFAFASKGRLVLKLPELRVDELVSSGKGRRFEPAPGRVMKEWVAVDQGARSDWLRLAREALDFAARTKKGR